MIGAPWHVPARSSGLTFDEVAEIVGRLRAGETVSILGTVVQMVPRDESRPLAVGDVLVGFCGGLFGRESYEDKTVEAIGPDYVVARTDHEPRGIPEFFRGDPNHLISHRRQS